LQLISSYSGCRVRERGSNTTPRPMEQHNDKRHISHQYNKRNNAISGRIPHQWSILLSCPCCPWPTYQPLQKVVPGDRRMAWPTGGKKKKKLSPDKNDPIQLDVAANEFVQVILMLRKTFIQDSVLMLELHACLPIWQQSIFSDPAYLPFKSQVKIIALGCSSMLTLIC
jgi:hypothetical protein